MMVFNSIDAIRSEVQQSCILQIARSCLIAVLDCRTRPARCSAACPAARSDETDEFYALRSPSRASTNPAASAPKRISAISSGPRCLTGT